MKVEIEYMVLSVLLDGKVSTVVLVPPTDLDKLAAGDVGPQTVIYVPGDTDAKPGQIVRSVFEFTGESAAEKAEAAESTKPK